MDKTNYVLQWSSLLDSTQIELVRNSWLQAMEASSQAGPIFFKKLFELDPTLKPLFKIPLDEQVDKLFTTISLAVRGLSDLASVTPIIARLGKRHVKYGVKDEHYDTVGTALLWTLEKSLGGTFTPDTKEAWRATYTILANVMKDAAASESDRNILH